MNIHLESAIKELYSEGDDFIVLGLTGRTGSGCSTVASILTSDKESIKHSLYSGFSPRTNEERKERIIKRIFESQWEPFILLQVRSLITLSMAQSEIPNNIDAIKKKHGVIDENFKEITEKLSTIKNRFDYISASIKKEDCIDEDHKNLINFYCHELPEICQDIKTLLGESNFVQLYQFVGKNLRTSGQAFDGTERTGNSFTIAKKINEAIKQIRESTKAINRNTLIVIDAIRNPLEALFFQERYSSFYLVAVSTPDPERKNRLRKLGYDESDIDAIDEQEYSAKDIDEIEAYSTQDIPSCLQRADIYIHNPDEKNKVSEFVNLANQTIKFATLMKRPGVITPTAIERCMQLAYTAKLNSGCISRQVGAALTDSNFSIRAIGWNDVPHGHIPCNLRNRFDLLSGKDSSAFSDFEKQDSRFIEQITKTSKKFTKLQRSMNLPYCFKSEYNALTDEKNQVHTRSLHAEENAFLQLSKYGSEGIEGGILFTTASPCELCSKKAYQLGISKIYYIDPYPGIAINHILNGGSRRPELLLFTGAIGKAFHRLYMPITAYKDELSALTKNI